MSSYSRFSELGREFGTSLTSKALNEASSFWDKMTANEKKDAQASFYKSAEESYNYKQVQIAKAKEQERLKEKAAKNESQSDGDKRHPLQVPAT